MVLLLFSADFLSKIQPTTDKRVAVVLLSERENRCRISGIPYRGSSISSKEISGGSVSRTCRGKNPSSLSN